MMTPNDFDADLRGDEGWNGYRPPMKWCDRVLLVSLAALCLFCVVGIPTAAVLFLK